MKNEKIKELFIDSGIHKRWHFTKYGYYKLFGSERFLFAHLLQLVATIAVVFSIFSLGVGVYSEVAGFQARVLFGFTVASLCQSISELIVGNFVLFGKLILAFLVFIYILYL
ncbi:hypothetical protein [Pseudoalteromonas sp. MEBiC 03485]|uniref:hypothetical protein n=1 Tax=Pseudoalteromonas sp. MEBiC 03485 TaxID=2571103 RepID=UPI0010205906|nr:hypothetical protein [Pseudoalteromonas sp. MEBiC 03485]RZD19678.1 hypothetical protein EVU92_20980 [Pseudoalteromonas sp. MEBiC 03485]